MTDTKLTHVTKEMKKLQVDYNQRVNELKIKTELLYKSENTCETQLELLAQSQGMVQYLVTENNSLKDQVS